MTGKVNFRSGTETDTAQIVALTLQMTNESLDNASVHKGVSAALKDDKNCRYFVAVEDQTIIACIYITSEWSDWRNRPMWWIQQALLSEKAQEKEFQDALLEYLMAESKSEGIRYLLLHDSDQTHSVLSAGLRKGMTTHYDLFREELSPSTD